jgi:hypothetical protein
MTWWKMRTQDDMPRTALEAVSYIRDRGIRQPARIKVKYARSRKEFDRIEDYEFRLNTGELLSEINANLKKPEEDVEVPF